MRHKHFAQDVRWLVGVHPLECSPPADSTSMAASASPALIASASVSIDAPNRCEVASRATGLSGMDASPSTRSASTAPASTEASWSASPTRTSRDSGRTASSRRAIIVSDTIEVSSTTITSCGSRLSRLCRNRDEVSGRLPSSRCKVVALSSGSLARSAASSTCDLLLHRLQQPGGGLAGRRGQRDPQPRVAVEFGLLGQQGQQPGDGGGLAGARPAGQHGQRPRQRDLRRRPLLGVAVREQPLDVQRRSPTGGPRPGPARLRRRAALRSSSGPGTAVRLRGAAPEGRRPAGWRTPRPATHRAAATAGRASRPGWRRRPAPRTPSRPAPPAPRKPPPGRPVRRSPWPGR